MATLEGKVLFITGASRGIGAAIAVAAAREGARVAVASKTDEPHPKLEGTIHSVAEECEKAGGKGLALKVDVRDEATIAAGIEKTVETFGGLDLLVNNAGYITLSDTSSTPLKRFDLMMQINARATFACVKAALPHLERSSHAHVLSMAPPIDLDPRWIRDHGAYTLSKYGMSLLTRGWAEEFRDKGIAANCLWPKTTIATAAIAVHFPEEIWNASRKPEIMADAATAILRREPASCTGNWYLDEEVLREEGVSDFGQYAMSPGAPLCPDLYIPGAPSIRGSRG